MICVLDQYFVCLNSCHLHHCTSETCRELEETPEGMICKISGFCFDNRPMLVAGDFVTFGKQQLKSEVAFATDASAMMMDDSGMMPHSEMIALEEIKDNPFDSRRERIWAIAQREHRARAKECDKLLELLLFSAHRRELNQWADEHTRDKHTKGVASYLRSQKTTRIVFEHIWRIISLDRNDTTWCVALPERDGEGHQACQMVCEQACVWWNRFVSDHGGKPLPNYRFKYHVLAVLFIYAVGMHGEDGHTPLLPASPILRLTLPGVETLKDFPDLLPGYYTNHERTCRERILAWIAKHKS